MTFVQDALRTVVVYFGENNLKSTSKDILLLNGDRKLFLNTLEIHCKLEENDISRYIQITPFMHSNILPPRWLIIDQSKS